MRSFTLITGLTILLALPAVAAEGEKAGEAKVGTSVEMPYLIAPLERGDSLLGYAYIACRIVGASPAAAAEIQNKVPFIQDALVRDVNASSVGKPDDPSAVDSAVLAARMLAVVRKVMGPGKVSDLKITQVQINPLHPSSVPPPPTAQ